MAIDPTTTTTVKVGELGSAAFNTTDLVPHEVGGFLKKGTLQDLANFIGSIIDVEGAIGFRAVQVSDGQTLPATDEQEFILVGPGTYPNVGGGPTITTTGSLNALVSNGVFWFIGVEIPIEVNGVWGEIDGVISDQTDLYQILEAKADLVDGKVPNSQLPSYVDDVIEVADYAALPVTGEVGKIYVTIDTGNVYRWSGSAYIRIANESPVWGIITGTLSDQTDLQAALDGKFDDPTGDITQYIAGDGSLITFPIAGQAGTLVRLVRNNSGATITKGTVVYINGASGNNPTIAKAIATGDSTSAQTFGLVQANISNNSNGYVVVTGDLIGVDTSAITEGSQLYLSSTTAGAYTTTKQLAPAHLVYVGVVTRSHASLGQIEVKIQNGYELDEIHDVDIITTTPTNGDILGYNGSLWVNKTIPGWLGYTPVTNARTISTTAPLTGGGDLTANRTISISQANTTTNGYLSSTDWTTFNNKQNALTNPVTGSTLLSGTTGAGYVPRATASTTLTNSLIYDNGTNVGIGTTSPDSILQTVESTTGITQIHIRNSATTGSGTTRLKLSNATDSNSSGFQIINSGNNGSVSFVNYKSTDLSLWTNSTERMRITSGGNVGINTTSPTIGKLQINAVAGTETFLALNSSNTGAGCGNILFNENGTSRWNIGTTSDNSLQIYNQGVNAALYIRKSDSNVGIGTTSPTEKLDVNGNFSSNNIYLKSTASIIGTDTTDGSDNKSLRLTSADVVSSERGAFISLFGNESSGTGRVQLTSGNVANGSIEFYTGATTERMRITSDGNVGIGRTSPNYKLDVNGGVRFTNGANPYLALDDGTNTSYLQVSGGNLDVRAGGANSITFNNTSERMRITSDGAVLLGTYSQTNDKVLDFRTSTNLFTISTSATAANGTTLSYGYASGSQAPLKFASQGGVVMTLQSGGAVNVASLGTGLVYSNGGTLTSANPSDSRLKDNIVNLDYGLNEILKLRPVTYNWKNDKIKQGKQFGFIAQEVQEVMPELVKEFETEDGERLGLDKEGIYAALVNAIQEQQKQIEELKTLINK